MAGAKELYTVTSPEAKIGLSSLQATFYSIDELPGYLAKVYSHERVWNTIPLDDPQARRSIIVNEVNSLQLLAPQLGAHFAYLQLPDADVVEEAIVMRHMGREAFLEEQIQRGNPIAPEVYQSLAARIADFQFNPDMCPPASVGLLSAYHIWSMQNEMELLRNIAPGMKDTYDQWETHMTQYITHHQTEMDVRQQLLGEPIVGHGDIKIANVILTDEGAGLIDPAPVRDWKIQDRRLDAHFLKADLELADRPNDAAIYWQAYEEAYMNHVAQLHLSPEELATLQQSNQVIDLISHIFRRIVPYRLALAAGNQAFAEKAKQGMDEAYGHMAA